MSSSEPSQKGFFRCCFRLVRICVPLLLVTSSLVAFCASMVGMNYEFDGWTMPTLKEGQSFSTMEQILSGFGEPPKEERAEESTESEEHWDIFYPNANKAPYTDMAPHIDLIWARGWYNAMPRPSSVPLGYYNERHRLCQPVDTHSFQQYFKPQSICDAGFVWVRNFDVPRFANLLSKLDCNITLATGECGDFDIPDQMTNGQEILDSPKIITWYAQNVVREHPKLIPIPIGPAMHYGFEGSPHTVDTLENMIKVRNSALPWARREKTIFYDRGTFFEDKSTRRNDARRDAFAKLSKCNNIYKMPPAVYPPKYWSLIADHQFGIAVTGEGWDTFRVWELLFYKTIPIVKKSPLDLLLVPAHVPVLIVEDWEEVCTLTGDRYEALVRKYKGWIANAHHWLKPSLWLPRNQTAMEELCDNSPGCRSSPWLSFNQTVP